MVYCVRGKGGPSYSAADRAYFLNSCIPSVVSEVLPLSPTRSGFELRSSGGAF